MGGCSGLGPPAEPSALLGRPFTIGGKGGHFALFFSIGQADVFALVEVDVCADDVPGSTLPTFVEDDVEVDVCPLAAPVPEPSLVEFVDEDVEVEACVAGVVEPD